MSSKEVTTKLSEEALFLALPRSKREEAYQLLRFRLGKKHRISVSELLKAHQFLEEGGSSLLKEGGDNLLPTVTSSSDPGESIRPTAKWAGGFKGPVLEAF
jgi:hypothetical protein